MQFSVGFDRLETGQLVLRRVKGQKGFLIIWLPHSHLPIATETVRSTKVGARLHISTSMYWIFPNSNEAQMPH
jgi:hypothetical protein